MKYKSFACAIGFHSGMMADKWTPNIYAEVVTEFEQVHWCRRCGKIMARTHLQWDGQNMVDVSQMYMDAK